MYVGIGLSIASINCYSFLWGINSVLYRSGNSYWRSRSNEVTVVLMIIVNLVFLHLLGRWLEAHFHVSTSNIISILTSLIFNVLFCMYVFLKDSLATIPFFTLLFVVFLATFILETIKMLVKRYIKHKNISESE